MAIVRRICAILGHDLQQRERVDLSLTEFDLEGPIQVGGFTKKTFTTAVTFIGVSTDSLLYFY